MPRTLSPVLVITFSLFAAPLAAQDWQPAKGPLMTRWAKEVTPEKVHPEYPRPQMVRETWLNLNGLWDYAITARDDKQPEKWDGKIMVPFPVESALSGVMKRVGQDKALWYRTRIPREKGKAWDGKRLLLHFGAVDWQTTVWINGFKVGEHTGGYDPFTFDVTEAIGTTKDISDELIIRVWDPTDSSFQPRGKQVNNPHGIWYTPVTGIWQTVWLEPVAVAAIDAIRITPDVDNMKVNVGVSFRGEIAPIIAATVVVKKNGKIIAEQTLGSTTEETQFELKMPGAELWTPDHPSLYDLQIRIQCKGNESDEVTSYFAMRKISLAKDDRGILRMMLNNKPLFHFGPLDQGWWPDGLYTAPTDAALKYDIEITKKLGFNMIRKHVKVEPARWYFHCDRLGMLVWQDMPNGDRGPKWNPHGGHDGEEVKRAPHSADNFNREWKAIIDAFRNHPSIVVWVPFNEAWGQFDTVRVSEWTKKYDPTRLVNAASGGNDFPTGDIYDIHRYPGPAAPKPDGKRTIVLGEYGGLGLPLDGHTWLAKGNWGYKSFTTREALTDAYVDLVEKLRPLIHEPGLSAAVYTQTTDVEVEVNGFMSYDRAVIKMPIDRIAAANKKLYLPPPVMTTLLATSQQKGATWSYTVAKPADGWEKADFDASKWDTGEAGFGEPSTPGSVIRTLWKTNDIWLRRTFDVKDDFKAGNLFLSMHHDENTQVYINGILAVRVEGYSTDYGLFRISDEAAKSIKPGSNTIAVHTKQTGGGQYIDVGIVDVKERE
ncbi:MAG: glycoside hydrolase family 2 TIM barrel-domain containing protein [Phycisphaeraceae bacterium]